ncbi:MAG: hypothetical protein M3N32_10070 [Actinomycetota bacterium]|nr:hypothetical protein [Actinomycetota bacterium]
MLPLKKGYCRLCCAQASLAARGQVTVLAPYLAAVSHHQLFFADMRRAMMRRGDHHVAPTLAPSRPAPTVLPQSACSFTCSPRHRGIYAASTAANTPT